MKVLEALNRIEENGYEAYIVGGYVRDYLLGIESTDIDICTNALVKDLLEIFSDTNATSNEYGSVKIVTNDSRIDITTYRKDIKYNGNRRKVEIEYVDNLIDDLVRRDFTMNALCMNKDGNIIDLYHGKEDIKNKIIRCIGDIDKRLEEDPLRMLRAVRFATVLDFTIEPELYKSLKKNKELLNNLSLERMKEELTKILLSPNYLKGLHILKDLEYLPYLGIEYKEDIKGINDICGMFSELEFTKEYPFSKEEKDNIKCIKEILSYGKIDNNIIFNYGLYHSLVAGEILNINKDDIYKMEKELPIKSKKDINITCEEICNILDIEPGKIINIIYDDLTNKLLNKEIENEKNIIENYLLNNKWKWLNEEQLLQDSKK